MRKAQEIFDIMMDRFVPGPKSILPEGWGKAPNLPKAGEIFQEMVDMGCNPDIVTYGNMLDILCKAGRVVKLFEFLRTWIPGHASQHLSFIVFWFIRMG